MNSYLIFVDSSREVEKIIVRLDITRHFERNLRELEACQIQYQRNVVDQLQFAGKTARAAVKLELQRNFKLQASSVVWRDCDG